MPSTLPELKAEVDQLNQDERFEPLKPLLAVAGSWINANRRPDYIVGLLDAVKSIQWQSEQGEDPRQVAERIGQGLIQPNWTVDRDVNQAGNDFYQASGDINRVVINVINNHLDKIEPTREAPPVRMDVVLLVMTRQEAEDLFTGKTLPTDIRQTAQGAPPVHPMEALSEEMQELCNLLPNRDKSAWIMRYGARPQDWRPAIEFDRRFEDLDGVPVQDVTIDTIVTHVLKDVANNYETAIVPNYVDIRSLHTPAGHDLLKKLRQQGCVVIVDVISLRHPSIQRCYRRSWLDAFPNTVIARIAPDVHIKNLNQRMTIVLEEQLDFEFHNRRDASDPHTSHVMEYEHIRDLIKLQTGHLLTQAQIKGVHAQTYQGQR